MIRGAVMACALVAATAACGDDAAPPESMPVEVTVLSGAWNGRPAPGLRVVFSDGITTTIVRTDDDGRARAVVAGEASVSVVRSPPPLGAPLESTFDIVTTTGVMPGDHLVFGTPARSHPVLATMSIDIPTLDDGTGEPLQYRVYGSCSSHAAADGPGRTRTLVVDLPCPDRSLDVHVEALDRFDVRASLTMTGQRVVAGGTLTLVGTWAPPVELAITYTDVPGGMQVYPSQRPYYRGIRTGSNVSRIALCAPTSTTCQIAPRVSSFVDQIAIAGDLVPPGEPPARQQLTTLVRRADGPAYTVAVRPLPWISDVAFDPASDQVSWHTSAAVTADATELILVYGPTSTVKSWLVFGRPDLQALQLPDLSSLGGDAPDLASIQVDGVILIDRDDLQGYDGFRPAAEPTAWTIDGDPASVRTSARS